MNNGFDYENTRDVSRMARNVRRFIRLAGTIIGSFFVYNALKSIPVAKIFDPGCSQAIFTTALAVFFFSWLIGAQRDTTIQEEGLFFENRDSLKWTDYLVMALIALFFIFLCILGNTQYLLAILFSFWMFNIIGYFYMVHFITNKKIEETQHVLEQNPDQKTELLLDVVKEYICGEWQQHRFFVGFVMALLFVVLSFDPVLSFVMGHTPFASEQSMRSSLFLIFVIIFEAWVWIYRLKTTAVIKFIRDMKL